jgi:hypothetical protein
MDRETIENSTIFLKFYFLTFLRTERQYWVCFRVVEKEGNKLGRIENENARFFFLNSPSYLSQILMQTNIQMLSYYFC